ncbi:PAS domain S-box-containing protein [Herbaspirillum sp. Sphag1AN]|uniref:ATP-binding sensor histidine kinase n=1 Tax=unclassified Herbaspirillum TaxID=2624150 RepID=UPI0016186D1C|nr:MULTISPECIES: AAA family ATPase [unclassified Herbaspirillum]MBB3214212.1 PAS domain S-box-containing protein [Herbaspirillum sp. Sphag1AN]MBB3247236.1 PAS domain S-box-containing protein [Herbaspirillum sp. Sphag64]
MKPDDSTTSDSHHAQGLRFSPHLYSRDVDRESLRSAFEHVWRTGSHALVIITGPSGIGKSALLNAFSDELQDRDANIAAGKVNQYLRNTPYSGLIDAFRSLVLQILHAPEENRQFWKKRLSSLLGLYAALAVSLIPELVLLLENYSQDAQRSTLDSEIHFQGLIHHLINGFSLPERPLVLLIDDVHWVDSATARALEYVVGASAALPFLLVLASREELSEGTLGLATALPLLRLRSRHSREIRLEQLSLLVLETFLADTFKTSQTNMREVAGLMYEKSKGNPFFVRQLLNSIADEGLMWFNHKDLAWQFDLVRIRALEYTDSIAEIMLTRLARLPLVTQTILASLASLGKDIELATLADILHYEERVLHDLLQDAIDAALVILKPQGYSFSHDRVQESAYAMISPQARMALHLRAAERLLRKTSAFERDDEIFQVLDHLAQGIHAATESSPCLEFAQLAVLAAQRAKQATAYACALSYLGTGASYLALSCSDSKTDIGFDLAFERAECEFLLGNVHTASQLSEQLITENLDRTSLAASFRLQAEICQRRSENWLAVDKALAGLRLLNFDIPSQPSSADCDMAYASIKKLLGDDPKASIGQIVPTETADIQTAVSLLSVLHTCAAVTNDSLHFIGLCQLLSLNIKNGFTTHFPSALGWFGVQVAHRYARFEEGFNYAVLGREMAAGHRYASSVARAILPLQQISVWVRPLQFSIDCAREGFQLAAANADVTSACYVSCDLISILLVKNVSLTEVRAEITRAQLFANHVAFQDAEDILLLQKEFVEHLCVGGHSKCSSKTLRPLRNVSAGNDGQPLSTLIFLQYLYAAIKHFHAREFDSASRYIALSSELTWSVPAHIHLLDFHFFAALILGSSEVTTCDHEARLNKLKSHHAVIADWATTNPTTFADKEAIVRAEIARLDGDYLASLSAFEEAIAHASGCGFLHYQGIAHELAARLALTRGYRTTAEAHIRSAHISYTQWGSLALAQQLERRYSALIHPSQKWHQQTVTDQADERKRSARGIDELRYISEALTSRDVIRRLLLMALESAGAGKGVFISCDGGTRQVEALAKTTVYGVAVEQVSRPVTDDDVLQNVLIQTIKTRHHVTVESLGASHRIGQHATVSDGVGFSILSLPVSSDGKVMGVLVVENFSGEDAFSQEDLQLLLILAKHAAVVLRNAAQYDALMSENAERRSIESELRSSQSSLILGEQFSHTGSMRWIIKDDLMACSAELCRIYGLPPGKTSLNFAEFMEIIHPDDRVSVAFVIHEAVPVGGTIRVEHRICRPDGTIRYVAGIGKPIYVNGAIEEYVGSATDVTVRRQSEDALRIAQADLARVSRAITVGQLTASIAHEINQPLMSIVSNAGASLRWLERDPVDLDMVSLGLKDIASEGKRAGDIIKGLQSLTRNSVPVLDLIDLHTMLRHVLAISRGEFERNCISVDLDLMARNSALMGDCVQIQQVLLNLVVNAIEAMAEINDRPRILSISTANPDDVTLIVHVKDTGTGIATTQLDKVFDAFYTTKKNGMGMGLAICRSIVEAHHGSLHVALREPHGLAFYFRLPLANSPSPEDG